MNLFDKTLEKMKYVLEVTKDSDVAEAIDMKPSAFANRKKSGSIPFSHYMKTIKSLNVNLNWLVDGEGPIYKDTISNKQQESSDAIPTSEKNTQVVIENQGILKRFKNPERAKAINDDLIEIEELSDKLIDSIASHIKSSLNAAKIIKGTSKKTPKDGNKDLQERKSS